MHRPGTFLYGHFHLPDQAGEEQQDRHEGVGQPGQADAAHGERHFGIQAPGARVLADKGFFPEAELWQFCKPKGILGGHPEYGKVPGVEASTGSLGHGLSIGVGMALNARFEKSAHRTFVVISDGESNEGSVWEAALCAAKHKLSNLVVLVDYNKQQSYGTTYEVLDMDPLAEKWRAFGFAAEEVDGHNVAELRAALARTPFNSDRPSIIICHTIKGKGISFVENNLNWHHKTKITDEEMQSLMKELGE